MQKLDRLMRIDKCKAINSSLKRINDISVCLIVVVFLSLIGMACTSEDFKELCFLGVALGVMAFTLELIACSSIVVYFCIRVRFVNSLIESYLKQDENVRKPMILDSAPIKYIRFLADTDNDFTTSQAHNYLKEIFSCFTMFQGLYRFQIYSLSQVASPVVFVIMDSFIAAFLAYRFQVFFYEVKRTKTLCIGVMAFQQDGPLRDKARTMLKMVEETPPTFSVYDMWEMNAGMFLTICSLVTGLIVTLIQFQFL
ncbi:Gustatory receptor 45 [Operophtera brumata]|uniref:Gustatory receptor 45 n=1 Tax=Operophtera brumata TaxID=104452 RepID=A0A0L7KXH1_OPEBR|nr:Gustatory receptor 45 [Operophtera brumata]